jgi:hypothetical protein
MRPITAWRLLALLVIAGMLAVGSAGCDRIELVTLPPDTVFVNHTDTAKVVKVDTLYRPRVDTVITTRVDTVTTTRTDTLYRFRVDTVIRVDTLHTPPRVDTLLTVRVDTVHDLRVDTVHTVRVDTVIQQRVDTVIIAGVVLPPVHDTTWVYVQQNPTNPVGGGDRNAGLAWIETAFGQALVFWHGNFVGVVTENPSSSGSTWTANIYVEGGGAMPWRGTFATRLEAIQALVPITITIGGS